MKEKILKGKVTKRLLSVVLALVMVFSAMPAMSITAMAEETQKPVTVASERPKDGDGDGYGYDTILTFSKSDAAGAKEYQYCVSYSKVVMEAMFSKYKEEGTDSTWEELLASELYGWLPLPAGKTKINLYEYYARYQKYVVDAFDIEPVENPVAIWICEKTEDDSIDWDTYYEATSEITYLPTVTNTWILPSLLWKVGGTPQTSYADPDGQFTATIQWYDESENLLGEGAQFDSTSSYHVGVRITPGEGYGKIPDGTKFNFGSLSEEGEYSDSGEDYPLSFDLGKAYETDQYDIMAVLYNSTFPPV